MEIFDQMAKMIEEMRLPGGPYDTLADVGGGWPIMCTENTAGMGNCMEITTWKCWNLLNLSHLCLEVLVFAFLGQGGCQG